MEMIISNKNGFDAEKDLDAMIVRLVAAFVAMDQRHREENLIIMEDDAKENPATEVPKLRLVVNK